MAIYDTAGIGASARIIVRPGGKLVVDGGMLTSACASEMAKGVLCFFYDICHEDEQEEEAIPKSAKSTKSGYESYFGNNSWEYSTALIPYLYTDEYDEGLLHCYTEVFKYTADNYYVANGRKYYSGSISVSEDTVTGRLYVDDSFQNVEQVICDMSLSVGDTFSLKHKVSTSGYEYFDMVVDSVYYINGKKQIHLKVPNDDTYYFPFFYDEVSLDYGESYNFSLRFMEGIGPIYSITTFGNGLLTALLCLHKDDTLYYMTNTLAGCYQYVSGVKELPDSYFDVYPNPVDNHVSIIFNGEVDVNGTVCVRDAVGRVCFKDDNVTQKVLSLNMSSYGSGIYFVTYIDKKNRQISKKILKK